MTAPRSAAAPPSGRSRARLARVERPLLPAGLRTHPVEYERRTTTFLDRALGRKETP